MLNSPEIRAEIDARLAAIDSEKILEEKALLEFLSAVVVGKIQDECLVQRLTGKGFSSIERHETRAAVKDRIKAAEILLKIRGAFARVDDGTNDAAKLFVSTLESIWQKSPA